MKTLKKQHRHTITTYVCDGCGKESLYMEYIDRCEATHKCEHSYKYEYWCSYDEMPGSIEKICSLCENIEGRVYMSDLDDYPSAIKIIYNIMKKRYVVTEIKILEMEETT